MKLRYILLTLFVLTLTNLVEAQQHNRLVFDDETAMKYFSGGFAKDSILTLYANDDYDTLTTLKKQQTFRCFVEKFHNYQIIVRVNEKKKELWLPIDGKHTLVDTWKLEDEGRENTPTDTPKSQRRVTRRFYYLGGLFSGSKGTHSGTISGRFGAFLYKDRWDISLTLNLGYEKNEEFLFTGSCGLDMRTYFPIRKIKLSPYVGGGVSWTFAPSRYFELRGLAGTCWIIGNGSIDAGIQYGLKSGFSYTIGYTFQPRFKAK